MCLGMVFPTSLQKHPGVFRGVRIGLEEDAYNSIGFREGPFVHLPSLNPVLPL